MNVALPEEEILGVVELLGFITDLCNNQPRLMTCALSRFIGVHYDAADWRDDVITCADYLARALGFADATLEAAR